MGRQGGLGEEDGFLVEVGEEEEEGEDAASMEVSAGQSETASTVSRATFSVGDKMEIDVREGGGILDGGEVEAEEEVGVRVEERMEKRGVVKDDSRAELRAAYVRELLLSSLSL